MLNGGFFCLSLQTDAVEISDTIQNCSRQKNQICHNAQKLSNKEIMASDVPADYQRGNPGKSTQFDDSRMVEKCSKVSTNPNEMTVSQILMGRKRRRALEPTLVDNPLTRKLRSHSTAGPSVVNEGEISDSPIPTTLHFSPLKSPAKKHIPTDYVEGPNVILDSNSSIAEQIDDSLMDEAEIICDNIEDTKSHRHNSSFDLNSQFVIRSTDSEIESGSNKLSDRANVMSTNNENYATVKVVEYQSNQITDNDYDEDCIPDFVDETVVSKEGDITDTQNTADKSDENDRRQDSEYAQILYELSRSNRTDGSEARVKIAMATKGFSSVKKSLPEKVKVDADVSLTDKDASEEAHAESDKSKRKFRILNTKPKRHTREAEVCFAQVGKSAKIWTQEHPQVRGIYLNKGKREVKRKLVTMKRQPTALDKGSYIRNGRINDKNRIDDYFVFTEEGSKRREMFEEGRVRDEYVVNWYMWCPGHGNCQRKCGGYGRCETGQFEFLVSLS